MSISWTENPSLSGRVQPDLSTPRTLGATLGPALFVGGALRICLVLWVFASAPLYNDAHDYFEEAVKIASGTREAVPFYWPPGMSYFLAVCFQLCGSSVLVARAATILLGVLQVSLVAHLTYELCGNRRAARAAGWIWALYPPAVLLSFQPYSQHLAAFCLSGAALYGIRTLKAPRWDRVLFTGLFLGLGCLTRPSMASVALFFGIAGIAACWHAFRAGQSRAACRLAVAVLLVTMVSSGCLAPVLASNWRAGAGITLSTNNQRNFFLGNNPYTPHYKTSHLGQHSLDEFPFEVQEYLKSHYERPDARAAMLHSAVEYIQANPGITVLRTANRARAFCGFDYLSALALRQTQELSTPVFLLILGLEAGGYCAVVLLALVALTALPRNTEFYCGCWCLGLTAAYASPYIIAFSAGTYHYPVMGLLIPFAAVAVSDRSVWTWHKLAGNLTFLIAATLFAALQLEYAYFAVIHC